MPISTVLKKRYKPPNLAFSIHRHNGHVTIDTVFSDTPAIDGGEKIDNGPHFGGNKTLSLMVRYQIRKAVNALVDSI
jgi:hypothetical protein